jgi:hypothetical protein
MIALLSLSILPNGAALAVSVNGSRRFRSLEALGEWLSPGASKGGTPHIQPVAPKARRITPVTRNQTP